MDKKTKKVRAEIKRIRAALDALHGRALTEGERETVRYLNRDLSKLLPMSGEKMPTIDNLFD